MKKEKKEQIKTKLNSIVSNLPEQPGSYQFWNDEGIIIYVGKAKNLKKRVSTYFHKEVDRFKTKVLVSKIRNITYTVVKTEEDALLLENSLIKKYKPKYNVLLKDGKTYPSICISYEEYPRIFSTRTINKKYGNYFGPYSHISTMYALLDIIRKLYKPRSCRIPLTEDGVKSGKYKTCLDYHIKKCDGPCINRISKNEYNKNIEQAKEILKGNTRDVSRHLLDEMQQAAEELRFEDAEELKQKRILIDNFCSKSEVVSFSISDTDVFSITNDSVSNRAFINYMHVTKGVVNQAFTYEYLRKLDESDEELLSLAIPEIRSRFNSNSREIIVPFEINWKIDGVNFIVPIKGDKKHLLELSELNGRQYRVDRLKQAEKLNPEQRQTRLMKELQKALNISNLPTHIECFDNSNISGTDAVAGCVVFRNLKPAKKEYRKYNIKTVVGPDDYASMKEVVYRRYSRMLKENTPLPNLIITDGGKGQMEIVRQVIENELHLDIPIAGLAKDNHHRTNELLFGFPPQVIGMKPDSELFHILTRIQDEVHRYAISFHRDKRSKRALHSILDEIDGIGRKTSEHLLKKWKTIKRLKEADFGDIEKEIGKHKASIVYNYLHKNDSVSEI